MNAADDAHRLPRWLVITLCAASLTVILALAWWVYHPGLSGDFLFDDFGSLPLIGATGPVDNWATFWRYITSGHADPTGRPIPLLTFLIDARDWPVSPYAFKVTNVILHLINGALLAWVLWKLGRVLHGNKRSIVIPGLPAGQNPESVRSAIDDHSNSETDSGSPLRGVRNDEFGDGRNAVGDDALLGVRNDELGDGRDAVGGDALRGDRNGELAASNNPHPLVIPGLPAGQNPESVRSAIDNHSNSETDSGSPLRSVRNDELGDGRNAVSDDALRGVRNDDRSASPLDNRAIAIAALFGAGAWLLHPLFVSATLYIVQREAMLPATFELMGMLGWMASRETLARAHVKRAVVGMALSAWLCTGLAVLSKANGALFPVLLLLTEWIVLSRRPMPTPTLARAHKRAVSVFLIVPSALVLGYLLSLLPHSLTAPVEARGWSIGQRLLTEPRVLADYLRLLFIPHAHSTGLFNDQFAVSTSWMHPASTIPCIVLITSLIAVGFGLRKRHPAIALALLFYFTAQLMESGWIPLELYFEHRNYVPALLLFWPIGLGLARPRTLRWLGMLAMACILLALVGLTRERATLWGDGIRQARVWAAINPNSARAQANAALYDLAHAQPRLAAARLRLSLPRHPDDIQAPINLISAECRLGPVRPATLAAADHALANTRLGGQAAFKWFNDALDMAKHHACSGLDFAALQATLDAARRNPYWQNQPGRQQDLHHLQGELDLAEGKPNAALASFNRALKILPNPGSALEQAAYLGSHGYPELGLAHLDYFTTLPPGPKPGFGMPRIHAWVLREQGWWPHEIAYLRRNLEEGVKEKAAAGSPQAPAPTSTPAAGAG